MHRVRVVSSQLLSGHVLSVREVAGAGLSLIPGEECHPGCHLATPLIAHFSL